MRDGLHLQDLTISLEGSPLLSLDCRIGSGEITTVMGPSGSGKSTLLAALTGTLAPAFHLRGKITLNTRDITDERPELRRIGLLTQAPLLFPHLSVGGNLAFGMPPGGTRAERLEEISAALDSMGLAGFAPKDPAELSGGQAARVALLRTLLAKPKALLLDEPFSSLDQALREKVRALVFSQAAQQGLPVLLVTHDIEDATAAGGPVIELSDTASPHV